MATKTYWQGNICEVSPTKVPLRLYDVRNQVSSLRKMVGGDNLQRLKVTKDDFSGTTPSCTRRCTKLTLAWQWSWVKRLVFKEDDPPPMLHSICSQCLPENIAISNCKAFFFCQNIKISSTGRAGSVGSVRDFFGLFSKTEQFSSGRLEMLTIANVEDRSCPIYEPGNVWHVAHWKW